MHALLFWTLAAIVSVCAIGVVVTQNIVRSATWLMFALGGVAGVFFLMGAEFVAATQLLVYVGGTLVLVVFGVMLTAQGPFINLRAGAVEWAATTVVGLLLFGVLAVCLSAWHPREESASGLFADPATSMNSAVLGESFLGVREATPAGTLSGVERPAPRRRRLAYLLPFEIVSVHLLVVLIGAAYLARAKRRRGAALS